MTLTVHGAVLAMLVVVAIAVFAASAPWPRSQLFAVTGLAWVLGALALSELALDHIEHFVPSIALRGGILLDRFELGYASTATFASAALALFAAAVALRAERRSVLYIVAPVALFCS